jgi:hypothetical protein
LTDREFLAEYARYNFRDGSAQKITCPVLVCEATADLFYSAVEESDPRKLYRHLTTSKKLLSFTEEEGGDAHCHPGALTFIQDVHDPAVIAQLPHTPDPRWIAIDSPAITCYTAAERLPDWPTP